MKYKFGNKSSQKLSTCHPQLIAVMQRALELSPYDFSIIHGHRGKEVQNALFDSGASKKQFPMSKHNATDDRGKPCSEAIDFAPWVNGTIDWKDSLIFSVIAGIIMAAATEKEVTIRWGGDWDSDGSSRDQSFMDIGHVEIIL